MTITNKLKELDERKQQFDNQIKQMKEKYEREIKWLSSVHQKELIGIERHTDSVITEFENNLETIIHNKDTEIHNLKYELQTLKDSMLSFSLHKF